MVNKRIAELKGKLIVSCQPEGNEAFYDECFTIAMTHASILGGSSALRLNGPNIVKKAKGLHSVPVIGLWKQIHKNSEVYITPTLESALSILDAGADIIALDATMRDRPDGKSLKEVVQNLKAKGALLMADISTLEEGVNAETLGFDCVGTTLSGYTSYTQPSNEPDFELLQSLIKAIKIPVICEGRINTPQQAKIALDLGAWSVVVGSAITRPQVITRRFVTELSN